MQFQLGGTSMIVFTRTALIVAPTIALVFAYEMHFGQLMSLAGRCEPTSRHSGLFTILFIASIDLQLYTIK